MEMRVEKIAVGIKLQQSGLVCLPKSVHYFKEIHYFKVIDLINLKLVAFPCPLYQGFALFQSPLFRGSTVITVVTYVRLAVVHCY